MSNKEVAKTARQSNFRKWLKKVGAKMKETKKPRARDPHDEKEPDKEEPPDKQRKMVAKTEASVDSGGETTSQSQFGEWLEKVGTKSTLEQQISFARELYGESCLEEPTHATGNSRTTSEMIQMLTQRDLSMAEASSSLMSKAGVSVDWILDVFCRIPFIATLLKADCNMFLLREVCVIQLLQARLDIWSGPLVNHVEVLHESLDDVTKASFRGGAITKELPTLFLSYTGRYSFSKFIQILEQVRGEYIWLDVFCVDQFAWTGQGKSQAVMQLRKDLINGLPEQIESIKRIALVLEKWDQVLHTLEQIWVLWEVFNAVQVKASAQILMSQAELKGFLTAVSVGDEKVQQSLGNIKTKIKTTEAKSYDNVARVEILNKMETVGHYTVNCEVTKWVRNWYCDKVIAFGTKTTTKDVTRQHTLHSVNSMACFLHNQGKLSQAEPLYREALSSRRSALGDDHPDTLTSINNMALLLQDQGKLGQAEPLYREALSSRRSALGDDHPDTLASINNMAFVLKGQGKFGDAESLVREALSSRRRILGDDHPDTLVSITTTAALFHAQGKLSEAEPLVREALSSRRRVLGDDHPKTLNSINNLAVFLQCQGKLGEAEPLAREGLSSSRRVLGEDHPRTLLSFLHMASLLQDQGNFYEAEVLAREGLSSSRRVLGEDHPHTLLSINQMSSVLQDQGNFYEAEVLAREGLSSSRRVLGENHPHTLFSINRMSSVLQDQGNFYEAEPLAREGLLSSRRVLGDDHPHTLVSINNMACFLHGQGQLGDAEPLAREALSSRRRVLGDDHHDTLTSINNMALLLRDQGKLNEAEPLAREVLSSSRRVLGDDHPTTRIFTNNLTQILRAQDRLSVT